MMTLTQVKQLLRDSLPEVTLRTQTVEDWKGPFPLPPEVVIYYEEVGPFELEIWGYGNPWYVPSLAALWDLQAGYRYDPNGGEHLDGWNDSWLVMANEGGDPFILDVKNGRVLYDLHGQGVWNPKPLFENLLEMISTFGVLGGISLRAGKDLTDDEGIRSKYQSEALSSLQSIIGNRERSVAVLEKLGWQ
jgi:hypothetical protein